MRGFLRGVIWGCIVAAGGLAVLSQVAPPRLPVLAPSSDAPSPVTAPTAGATTGATASDPTAQSTAEVAGQPAPAPASPETTEAPAMETVAVAPPAKDAPATAGPTQTPETSASIAESPSGSASAVEPSSGSSASASVTGPDVSATPSAEAPPTVATTDPAAITAPAAPEAPSVLSVTEAGTPETTQPAAPVQPAPQDGGVATQPAPIEPPKTPPSDLPQIAAAAPPTAETAAIAIPSSDKMPGTAAPAMPGAPLGENSPSSGELPPPPEAEPTEDALLTPSTEDAAPIAPAPPVVTAQPETTVVTNRLPRIGDLAPEAVPASDAQPILDDYDPSTDETLPPILRYARRFENPDQKPLFAILLEDRGGDVDREMLAAIDLPLTIVIDPLSDGAAERAAIWRAGRQEVIYSLSGLPEGATATDVEQTLQAIEGKIPEAVAIIDADGASFQGNRLLATQIVDHLKDRGRGLVTYDQGLNSADQVARREDVASAVIFRRIDLDQPTVPAIKRYLDRAVFRAAQEGEVAVIGELSEDVVEAVMSWAIEGRAASVAAAPITALFAR